MFATGNNLVIADDLTRRTLRCALDAKCERPELRKFEGSIMETTRANRASLVTAALTVLRAWHVAGEDSNRPPLGSFETWSRRIRDPLIWLGCADPCDSMEQVRDHDPRRAALIAVVTQWRMRLGVDQQHTVQDVIACAINAPDFHAALMAVARSRTGSTVSNDRLGRWLSRVAGKIVANLKLVRSGLRDGYPLWTLTG